MNNNTTLIACTTLALPLTFNDVYLIIVGISLIVSTVIAVINAIKSGKQITIDKSTQDQLKDIDEQLNKDKDKDTK